MPSPSPTDYADLFVAAIEGGINYWAEVETYRHWFADLENSGDPGQDYAKAIIIEDETRTAFTVDSRSENWHTAVAKAADYFGMSVAAFIEDHDAGSGDVVMQFALFGEVVYG